MAVQTGLRLDKDKEIEERKRIRIRPGYLAKWVEFQFL